MLLRYALLRPGETHSQPTYPGDAWLLRSRATRRVLRRIDAQAGPAVQCHLVDLNPGLGPAMEQSYVAALKSRATERKSGAIFL